MKTSSEMSCIARSKWSWQSSGIVSLLLSVFLSLPLAAQSTPATITSPGPGSALTGTTVTFTWTAGTGLQRYQLYVGTSLRSNVVFGQTYTAPGTTSAQVTGIPARGGLLYVTLYSQLPDGSWQAMDYTYKESGTPQTLAITPVNSSIQTQHAQYFTSTSTDGSLFNLAGVTQLGMGSGHTCALLTNQTVECWGNNSFGQLGNGTFTASSTPVLAKGITGVTAIAVGSQHTCALKTDGTLRCWGANDHGQLGNGKTTNSNAPVKVTGLAGVTTFTAGFFHSCAVIAGGVVKCWGRNDTGALGNNSHTDSSTAVSVTGLSGITGLGAGEYHTCAVTASKSLECWGDNEAGQLGDGQSLDGPTYDSPVPVAVTGLGGSVSSVDGGQYHTCALLTSGNVQCWGDNTYGQLGNGTNTQSNSPITVSAMSGATKVATGANHSCAVLASGAAKCWGFNGSGGVGYGQLGNGSFNDSTTPVSVSYLGTAVNIAGGTFSTCAALIDGSADCWGNNTNGQLGNGTVLAANIPMTVLTSNGGQALPIKIGSNSLKYSTGDSAIASASGSSGIVTGKGTGSTTVKVTLGTASATTSITVN